MNDAKLKLEPNFYELLSAELGVPVDAAPLPNFPALPALVSNIVPGPNGAVMNGGALQSSNFIPRVNGWRFGANGILEAINAILFNIALRGIITFSTPPQLPSYLTANLPTISADSGTDDATVGTVVWDNPSNAIIYTGLLATTSDVSGVPVNSHYLKVTDFDYAIPADATILGIQVEIDKLKRGASSAVDNQVKLVRADGTFGSVNKADASTQWPDQGIVIYGGPTDLWGQTWTPADINNPNFGAAISCAYTNTVASGGPGVALVRVIVFYTGQTTSVGIGSLAFAIDGTNLTGAKGTVVIHDGRTWRELPAGLTSSSFLTNGNDVAVDATPNTNQYQSGRYTGGSSSSGFNAGASLAVMDLLYLDASSLWQKADANAAASAADVFLGIPRGSYSVGQQVIAILPGSFVRNDAWNWTPGVPLYISETAGAITATPPSTPGAIIRKIGYAVTADVIWFDPSDEYAIAP